MDLPAVVSMEEWQSAREELLAKEKAEMRARDALAAERRRLPMVEIAKNNVFDGPDGETTLLELFAGRRQLLLYHFMFAPGVQNWPDGGCPGCSMFVDNLGHLAHLRARGTSFVLVSRAPLANIEAYRARMAWDVPWYSSERSDFNDDFGMTTPQGETFGLSVFVRDGDRIFRSYFTDRRAVEAIGPVWSLLDLTPLGRQETWEDTPGDRPQTEPYSWWRLHDEYEEAAR